MPIGGSVALFVGTVISSLLKCSWQKRSDFADTELLSPWRDNAWWALTMTMLSGGMIAIVTLVSIVGRLVGAGFQPRIIPDQTFWLQQLLLLVLWGGAVLKFKHRYLRQRA